MTPVGDFIGDQRRTDSVNAAYGVIAECTQQIDQGRDFIVLVLSGRTPPTGEKVRLTKTEGPLGEILVHHVERQETVARFKPVAVRTFLRKKLAEAGWDV